MVLGIDQIRKQSNLGRKVIQKAIDLLSENETDEDINEYLNIRMDIQNKIKYDNSHDYLAGIGRENLITLISDSDFEEGMVLNLYMRAMTLQFTTVEEEMICCGQSH